MSAILDRLMSKVVWNGDEDECWTWEGARERQGYGHLQVDGRTVAAHRVAYELFVGPIPDGRELDHTCHNESDCAGGPTCPHRACCNPAHLEPVTGIDNKRRGKGGSNNRAKTHCPQGHPYAGDNLYVSPKGRRLCRTCNRASHS